ncbi:FixH family protein [Uliginosibacterium sp. H1]|uniref:FixH family protein n=1 Tax=Uliginosibacterium sp. H1 TaxID=3114757 RepID=UPI002E193BC2|nr:FixH family protein [Uliginosibacterium sp. H1]
MNAPAHRLDRDAHPWWHYPWPWILFGIPALTMVAGIITFVIAANGTDGVVAEDYYKQGLTINRTLARGRMAADMGLAAELVGEGAGVRVQLSGREGLQLPAAIDLTLAHPTRGGQDRRITFVRTTAQDGGGVYRLQDGAALDGLATGRWHVIIEDATHAWRLDGNLVWPLQQALRIDAASR